MAQAEQEAEEILSDLLARPNKRSYTGNLIVQVNSMMKKPQLDDELTKVLRAYQGYLKQTDLFIKNGLFNIKFSEAALFIQCCGNLFAKKVDLLWELMTAFHERQINYEEKNEKTSKELAKLEARKDRFKRKRKPKAEVEVVTVEEPIPIPPELPAEVILDVFNEEYAKEQEEIRERQQSYQNNPKYYFENWFDLHYDEENPMVDHPGRLNPNIRRCFKQWPFKININAVLNVTPIGRAPVRDIDENGDLEVIAELHHTGTWLRELITIDHFYIRQYYHKIFKEDLTPRNYLEEATNIFMRQKNITYDELTSKYEEEFAKFYESYKFSFSNVIRMKQKHCPKDVSVMLDPLPQPLLVKYLKKQMRITVDSKSDLDSGFFDNDFDCSHVSEPEIVAKGGKKRSADPNTKVVKSPRKRTLRLKSFLSTSLPEFDCFFQSHYISEAGEGEVPPSVWATSTAIGDTSKEFNPDTTFGDDHHHDDEGLGPSRGVTPIQEFHTGEDLTADGIRKRYLEWKAFIEVKLNEQNEHDFNIHAEGSEIIEKLGVVGTTKTYKSLCTKKTSKQVTRNLAALLQLGNAGNVQLINPQANRCELANDTLEIKLLSIERQHEHLTEYVAPSETTLQSRLQNVRDSINSKRMSGFHGHSSQSGKKRRLF